ncbi:MAG: hypothetical protein GKS06_11430 [Acidobacteria bacterium]|nr:hypothetical protein [Acidobacteriota bacterium]
MSLHALRTRESIGPANRAAALTLVLAVLLLPATAVSGQEQETAATSNDEASDAGGAEGTSEATGEPSGSKGILAEPIQVGDDLRFQFGGFVKTDLMQDLDPIGNAYQFKVNSIPIEGTPESLAGGRTTFSARQTRLTVDMRTAESAGGVRAYVETDFFGDGNSLRIRHAFGEWKGLMAGQNWSTFQDIETRPATLDYEGPDSEVFVRQVMVRYTGRPSEELEWSVALEDPDSQVTVGSDVVGSGRSQIPDFAGRAKFKGSWGQFQAAGLLRQIRFVSDDGLVNETTGGYGINVAAKLNLGSSDALMGHFAVGSGIGRYIEVFNGTGTDATLTPDGKLEAMSAYGFVAGFTHHWDSQLQSTLSGGLAHVGNEASQPDDAIQEARSVHLNLVYAPIPLVNIGGEVMWGERVNKNGDKGSAVRLQFQVTYKFR